RYADRKLRERGVEIRAKSKVAAVRPNEIELCVGEKFVSSTLVWTAVISPNPILELGPCEKERGRVRVKSNLKVEGVDGLWALGDCALVPDSATGKYCPPTAQHASREGKVVARNIIATIYGRPKTPFSFKTLGSLAAIGRRTGVARIIGINFSGFLDWFLWRGIYWSKLPLMEKKGRVAIDWALDVLFTKDVVQFLDQRALAHTQTETGAALWNREHISVAGGVDAGHVAATPTATIQPGSSPPGYNRRVRN